MNTVTSAFPLGILASELLPTLFCLVVDSSICIFASPPYSQVCVEHASKGVLALASLEVDLSSIEPGSTVTVKWRGKPIFIRRRTENDIMLANSVDVASLRDPQDDSARVKNPEWLVVVGVCTHLGCIPLPNAGDFGGWLCPCHGSHYDVSGRILKGLAPFN